MNRDREYSLSRFLFNGKIIMDDVKVQLTQKNIEYKHKLGISFAKLINGLMDICRSDKELEMKLVEMIKGEGK